MQETTPISLTGTAKIKLNATNKIFEIKPEDLEWRITRNNERNMGPENIHFATVELESESLDDELDADLDEDALKVSVTWEVSEYPLNSVNFDTYRIEGKGELVKNFDSIDLIYPDEEIY